MASLNHPNIGAIYGLEKSGDTRALVLELVEGPTLADRISQGPIPINEALPIAKQIAEALEAAHEAGVIHRDLKPANIKVKDDGTVKVLDFGLAKALEKTLDGDSSQTPTRTAAMTATGVVMGTAAYMSPEQARGEVVDTRTDVWAFGCVLFEMLTGRPPFPGRGATDVLAEVLKGEPDWRALPASTPSLARRVLRRCLEKDRRERLQHLGDARADLRDSLREPDAIVETAPPQASRITVLSVVSVLLAAATVGVGSWWLASRSATPTRGDVISFEIAGLFSNAITKIIAVSPDGRHIVHSTTANVGTLRSIEQTREVIRRVGGHATFSPDGQHVASFSEGWNRVAVAGGAPTRITNVGAEARLLGSSWGSDNYLVYANTAGLHRVSMEGGEPVRIAAPDQEKGELLYAWPEVLPDANTILFTIVAQDATDVRIGAIDLRTGELGEILRGGTTPNYVPTGHLVYASERRLHAVSFDPISLEIEGDPVLLLDEPLAMARLTGAQYDISNTGTLVYQSEESSTPRSALRWVDRTGREEPIEAPDERWVRPRLSPDATQVAFGTFGAAGRDIHVWDMARNNMRRVTFDPAEELFPLWSPDGTRLFFSSDRNGTFDIFTRPADGTGSTELLYDSPATLMLNGITPDGETLLVVRDSPGGAFRMDLIAVDIESRESRELLATEATEFYPSVSPEGRWVVYQSDLEVSGRLEVYVSPYPAMQTRRWKISNGGGESPFWAVDGREIFFVSASGSMMVAEVALEPTFEPGPVREMIPVINGITNNQRAYDVSAIDGRFLMHKSVRRGPRRGLTVVVNWFDALGDRLPLP